MPRMATPYFKRRERVFGPEPGLGRLDVFGERTTYAVGRAVLAPSGAVTPRGRTGNSADSTATPASQIEFLLVPSKSVPQALETAA